jgi:quercetin dioxygenase-like cupin family protein
MPMTATKLKMILAWLNSPPLIPPEAKVTELAKKDLPDLPGHQASVLTIEYPPGGAGPLHRYRASTFIYVLQDKVSMQTKDGETKTLMSGQAFCEAPGDSHVMMWNASKTQPAKFVVFLISGRDIPLPIASN